MYRVSCTLLYSLFHPWKPRGWQRSSVQSRPLDSIPHTSAGNPFPMLLYDFNDFRTLVYPLYSETPGYWRVPEYLGTREYPSTGYSRVSECPRVDRRSTVETRGVVTYLYHRVNHVFPGKYCFRNQYSSMLVVFTSQNGAVCSQFVL